MLDKKTVSQCISSDYCRGWNDAVDAMPRWISVEERLPEKCEYVICIVRFGEDAWNHELGFVINNSWVHAGRSDGIVTHWMTLPEPPKEATP